MNVNIKILVFRALFLFQDECMRLGTCDDGKIIDWGSFPHPTVLDLRWKTISLYLQTTIDIVLVLGKQHILVKLSWQWSSTLSLSSAPTNRCTIWWIVNYKSSIFPTLSHWGPKGSSGEGVLIPLVHVHKYAVHRLMIYVAEIRYSRDISSNVSSWLSLSSRSSAIRSARAQYCY